MGHADVRGLRSIALAGTLLLTLAVAPSARAIDLTGSWSLFVAGGETGTLDLVHNTGTDAVSGTLTLGAVTYAQSQGLFYPGTRNLDIVFTDGGLQAAGFDVTVRSDGNSFFG